MGDEERIIPSSRFKGKKIEMAPAGGIELFRKIAEDFMLEIFRLEPGDYLISDESDLRDFVGVDDLSLAGIHQKIQARYGLDVSGLRPGNLLKIFVSIHEQQAGTE
jgi:hypothetical protein